MPKQRTKFWSFKNTAGKGQLYLYGPIDSESWWGDEVTPKQFQADLAALGNITQLDVFINSDGGDVFAGQAIHSMLKRHAANVTVYIDGLAASIASVIAMAGDQIIMPRNAMMMVHNPWSFACGNAQDFRSRADDLDKIRESLIAAYQDKSGMSTEEITALLDAETWLTAEEAVSLGFADEIEQTKQVAASVRNGKLVVNGQTMDLSPYQHPQKAISTMQAAPPESVDPDEEEDAEPLFTIGDDIQLKIPPRVPGQSTGDVREVVLTYVYGIVFDGMEDDGIYHWYTESELAPGTDPVTESPEAKRPSRSLSLYERRLKNTEKRLVR